MNKSLFVLTGNDLAKLSVIILIAVILFGLTGLLMMLLMKWFTLQSYAKDSVDKHGISSAEPSRLGGAAVFLCVVGLIVAGYFNGKVALDSGFFMGSKWLWWLAVICCGLLGVFEDLSNGSLSPRFRLFCELVIFLIFIGFLPYLIPVNLGVTILDFLISLPIMGWLITAVFCVGFVNSINMADGANGLMPGIMTIAFGIMFVETEAYVYGSLMSSCGLFTVFNMISGRLVLGDAGAYGLGAILVLSGLHMFSENVFSAWYLACLLAYPCIDFVSTLIRRMRMRLSIFQADDDHLHNRIHNSLKQRLSSRTLANSLTGAVIVTSTSGLALMGYLNLWWPITSELWGWLFLIQSICYCLVFYITGLNHSASHYSLGN